MGCAGAVCVCRVLRQRRFLMSEQWRSRITIEPGKRSGQPCIRGMRITVQDVLEYLAGGMTAEEVLADFPELTMDDIRACLDCTLLRDREPDVRAFLADPALALLVLP